MPWSYDGLAADVARVQVAARDTPPASSPPFIRTDRHGLRHWGGRDLGRLNAFVDNVDSMTYQDAKIWIAAGKFPPQRPMPTVSATTSTSD